MLWIHCFKDGGALRETAPQGDVSFPVKLPKETAEALAALLTSPERSAALAQLFLDGATAGERAVRGC